MEKDKGLFSFRKHPVGDFPDGKKGRKRKGGRLRRSMGFLLAAALIFNMLPASGLAVSASEPEKGLCEHHQSHTAECGYAEAQPCTHEHGEECYKTVTECVHTHTDECYPETEATEESTGEGSATTSDAGNREPSLCAHVCKSSEAGLEESGCITKVLDCHHEHDESCGYQEAQDCGYVCEICNGTEPEDTEDTGTDTAKCICETLCTEDNGNNSGRINGDCPVCGADDASLLDCKGKVSEENTENQEDTGICKHHQEHDADCGYIPKSEDGEGSPCTYECRICPVEDLIAALPDKVTEDNGSEVRAQLDEILALYRELNEDEQEEINLSRIYALQGALDAANAPMMVAGEIDISQNRNNILTAEAGGCPGHTFTGATGYGARIYVESGTHDVTFSNLNITNGAQVGIAPGAAMNLTIDGTNTIQAGGNLAGIYVPVGATLIINGTGSLNVSGSGAGAGIGGAIYAPDDVSDGDPNCGTVVINGGIINATGGGSTSASAGIGGGTTDDAPGNGGNVTINGGTVTATGGSDGYYGGAGIGGAGGLLNERNELVSGNGGTLTINGGTVNLTAGTHDPQYPAYGFGRGSSENTSGVTCELTLADASYLDSSTTLDPNGKYTINGDPTADMIVVPTDLVYNGKAQELDRKIYIDDAKTGTGTYFNQTFTVKTSADGWELQPLSNVVEAGEYTATFKKGDKEISKTFTVAQSGTDLTSEGKVLTYNGETETTSFSAGDTIKVVAAPTPTGAAPTNSAMFAASFTPPTTGQMAVFVGDTQVSEPVGAGEDGSYTMTVSAADVLLAAGGPGTEIPLTAKFIENTNMADGAGTATVNITAVAVAEKDGKVIGYYGESGLDTALADKNNEGAVFTLLDNMERETDLKINISCTLDLNGKTIRSKGEYVPTLSTYYGTAVTIRGEGTVISEQGHGFSVGGTTTLEGGTFISGAANCGGVYVQAGKLIVTGEAVVIENTGGGTGLGVGYNAEVQLSGGTCEGGAAAIEIYGGTGTLAGLLNQEGASRVAYYKDNTTLVTEGLDGQALPSGSYTVKACAHIFGSSTTCPACGEQAVARVTIGDAVTHYGDLPSAWAAVQGQAAELFLLKSVDAAGVGDYGYLDLRSGSVTLGMADGVVLSGSSSVVIRLIGGELTLNSGTIHNGNNNGAGLRVEGGTLRVRGGTVNGKFGIQAISGQIEITGGTFTGTGIGLNAVGTVKISGGQFSGSQYAVYNRNGTLADLLAEGYAFKQNGNWVTDTSGKQLTGTVTVESTPVKITAQPVNTSQRYGDMEALSIETSPGQDESVTYQWYVVKGSGAEAVSGEIAPVFSPSENQRLDVGSYQYFCEVTKDSYTLRSNTVTFTVTPRQVNPSITGTAHKEYDGTTNVTDGQLSITLEGVVTGDDVTASATSYAYDNANAGENKTITASGITLEGDSKDNYTLSSTTATTAGTITKSQPAIVFASGYNPSKDYDGQAIPDPTADNLTITGADFSDVTFAWSATPKDAGTYTLTAAIPETTNTEAVSATLTVTISPKTVTPAITITPSSYEYTGSAIRPSGSAVKVMDGNTVIPDSEYTLSYGENTQAGNGSVTVTDKENGNYTIAQTTETFTITKANQATLTITGAPGSVTYGDTFQLSVSGGSGSGAVSWAASGATVDNAGNVTITRAGTVIITAAKDGDSNYSGIEAQIMLNVSKKSLTVSGVDAQDRAYDGTNKVAITAVTLSGIVPGDEGKVEVGFNGIQGTLSGVNAGTYTSVTLPQLTLTGEGSGNYTLLQPETAVPASVKITPLDAVITIGTDTYHKTFGDAAFTLDVTDNNTEADVQYEVTEGADVVSVENGTVTIRNAGTAAITVSLPASTNYNAAENKTITVTVDKKNGYTVAALNRNYFYQDGGTDSIDLAALLPKDCGDVTYGEPAVSGNVTYSAAPAVSGGKLSYTLDSGSVNDAGTVTVTVTTRNFEDITVTVNVKLTDQIPVSLKTGTQVTLKNNVLTYGEPLSDLAFNEAEFVGADGKTVTGTLAWKEAAAILDAGTASAVWIFTPAEDKYASLEGTAAITVNKAVPTVSAVPTVADRIYNPSVTLKGDDLTGATVTGVDGNTLEGTWNWQNADIVPTVNNSGYAAIFTPEDTTNYETVTRTITVNVAKATPYIAVLPAAAEITYGETLKDSALSGGTVLYGDGRGQAGDSDGSIVTGTGVSVTGGTGGSGPGVGVSVTGDGSTVAVTGTFTWQEPSTKPVVADSNVTEYTLVFTPSDTANFHPVEAKTTLTVNKAQNAPDMPGSTMDVPNSFEKAGDVPLPEGWEWQASDRDTALEVGKPVSAVAVYAGADKGNYEKETVTVAITRSACDHVAGDILYTGAGEMAPTCTEDGLGHRECTKCGDLVESGIVVKALGHTGGTATCFKRAVCTRCNQPYGDLDSGRHGDTEIRGFTAATCTAGGYTGDTCCKDCGVRIKTGSATPALGHNYTGTVTKEPTTDSEGTRTYTCTRCGHSYTESMPRLPEETHHHSYSGSVTKQPTCTDTGVRTYTCSCGDSYTETIAVLGHHYQSRVTKQPTTMSEGVMTYTCTRCGHSYTRPIAKLPGGDTTKPGGDTTKPGDDTTKPGDDTAKPGTGQPGDTEPDSGSTDEGRPDTGIPFLKDEDGKVGWDVIRAEEEQAGEGSIINVNMNGTTVVPGDIFDSIKGKNITITFDMGNGILWSVDGKSITGDTISPDVSSPDKAGGIDFSVQTGVNAVPVDIVNKCLPNIVTGERYSIQISLAHEGEFGFTAVLSIGLGRENAGYTASLYYYNESTGELELICSDEVAEDGTVSLAFTHASDYVIAIAGEGGNGSVTEPAQPEDQDADSTGQAEESPQTGQAWKLWWLIVTGALVIAVGIGLFSVMKKKEGD